MRWLQTTQCSNIKNKYTIPVIEDLIDELHNELLFPKINLSTQDIGKDAFGTHVAYSACLVIPLGWLMPYNIPISYEQISSPIPKEICARVFFGDIHIYRKTPEQHK